MSGGNEPIIWSADMYSLFGHAVNEIYGMRFQLLIYNIMENMHVYYFKGNLLFITRYRTFYGRVNNVEMKMTENCVDNLCKRELVLEKSVHEKLALQGIPNGRGNGFSICLHLSEK